MNNFCIVSCLFSVTKLLKDSKKNLEHLFGENLSSMFLVFTPSVGVKLFWVDLDGKHDFAPTPSVGVVHM
jgi:hypothetical protein